MKPLMLGPTPRNSKPRMLHEAAAEEAFEDRRVVAGPGDLAAHGEDVLAGAVGALLGREVTAAFDVEDREGIGAEDLLVG